MKVLHFLNILKKLSLGLLLGLFVSGCELATSESVSVPNPPKAKESFSAEQQCVDSIEVMRRDHGWFLQHSRDDSMYRGIRTIRYSLRTCINCHVKADEAGNYPNIKEGTDHFCRSCHVYAAVSIDCFQCHANKPAESFTETTINSLKFNELAIQTASQ